MSEYYDPNDDDIYIGSCLYSSSTAAQEFEAIAKFLTKNPSEIVILDLNGDWLHTTGDNDFFIKLDSLIKNRFLMTFVLVVKLF